MNGSLGQRRLGVAIVGLGGAVATTAITGIELLQFGLIDAAGLPLAERSRKQNTITWQFSPSRAYHAQHALHAGAARQRTIQANVVDGLLHPDPLIHWYTACSISR